MSVRVITVRMCPELHAAVMQHAKDLGMSANQLAVRALTATLPHELLMTVPISSETCTASVEQDA